MRPMVVAVAAVLLAAAYAPVQPPPVPAIKFAPGTSTATVSQSVERGAGHTWTFAAKAGQHADIGTRQR